MHHGHTWHDYPWPWVFFIWLLYNLQLWRHRRWFRKFAIRFRPIRKEIASSMYNNMHNMIWHDMTSRDVTWHEMKYHLRNIPSYRKRIYFFSMAVRILKLKSCYCCHDHMLSRSHNNSQFILLTHGRSNSHSSLVSIPPQSTFQISTQKNISRLIPANSRMEK